MLVFGSIKVMGLLKSSVTAFAQLLARVLLLVQESRVMNRDKKGFTIVELLIVVVVIAILATITVVAYNGVRQRAETSANQTNMRQLLRKIQVDVLQQYGITASLSAPIAYITQTGTSPLVTPIENEKNITLYTVFNTTGSLAASWGVMSQLHPRTASNNKFEIRTNGVDNATVNAAYSTSAQNDLSISQNNIRDTTGRHVGWQTASESIVETGFDKSTAHSSRIPSAHSGWNFTDISVSNTTGIMGIAAIAFAEYHNQATRLAVLKWLDSQYAIDYFNE